MNQNEAFNGKIALRENVINHKIATTYIYKKIKKTCLNFLKSMMGKIVKAVAILPSDICNCSVFLTN